MDHISTYKWIKQHKHIGGILSADDLTTSADEVQTVI